MGCIFLSFLEILAIRLQRLLWCTVGRWFTSPKPYDCVVILFKKDIKEASLWYVLKKH
jgi:hypothetical protein